MTVFDYVFLSVLALSATLGLWRGLVSEILGLLAWVLALVVAGRYVDVAALQFENMFGDSRLRVVAAFALIFFAVLLLASLVKFLLRKLLRAAGLGAIDRFFGAVFGAVRGFVIALVVVWIGGLVGMSRESWWEQALFAPPLENVVNVAKSWLPGVDSVIDSIHLSYPGSKTGDSSI
ncbi:MAG: CvpA family protein [Azoarcus sp.]|jgi:membrane protein required for colicin V production|nr:CvpA family protein [Azoarcus sp.]